MRHWRGLLSLYQFKVLYRKVCKTELSNALDNFEAFVITKIIFEEK
jgi:hypothetical protein